MQSVKDTKTPATRTEMLALLATLLLKGDSRGEMDDAVALARSLTADGEASRRMMNTLCVGLYDHAALPANILYEVEMAEAFAAAARLDQAREAGAPRSTVPVYSKGRRLTPQESSLLGWVLVQGLAAALLLSLAFYWLCARQDTRQTPQDWQTFAGEAR